MNMQEVHTMKENFVVSFEKSGVTQSRLVTAESADQAQAYFQEIEPAATVYGVSLDTVGYARRGMPCEVVPDGWKPQDTAEDTQDTAEDTQDTATIYDTMTAELKARKDRSAWDKGVTLYALELVEELEERAEYEGRNAAPGAECEAWLLNGANNWNAYSWGGSSLIYDGDIAKRLCTPSELKKTRQGERRPNSREEWLDVQARALFQACNRVKKLYRHTLAEMEG
jgi:hypothetical protein